MESRAPIQFFMFTPSKFTFKDKIDLYFTGRIFVVQINHSKHIWLAVVFSILERKITLLIKAHIIVLYLYKRSKGIGTNEVDS